MNGLLGFVLKEFMLFSCTLICHWTKARNCSLGLLDLSYLDSKTTVMFYSYAQFVFHLRRKVVTIMLQCVISG